MYVQLNLCLLMQVLLEPFILLITGFNLLELLIELSPIILVSQGLLIYSKNQKVYEISLLRCTHLHEINFGSFFNIKGHVGRPKQALRRVPLFEYLLIELNREVNARCRNLLTGLWRVLRSKAILEGGVDD